MLILQRGTVMYICYSRNDQSSPGNASQVARSIATFGLTLVQQTLSRFPPAMNALRVGNSPQHLATRCGPSFPFGIRRSHMDSKSNPPKMWFSDLWCSNLSSKPSTSILSHLHRSWRQEPTSFSHWISFLSLYEYWKHSLDKEPQTLKPHSA